jgi:3-oxoacyl-[acyl-carrier-protein] synthase II
MNRRVVITGLGCLTPAGNTPGELWTTLLSGDSGIRSLTRFQPEDGHRYCAGEINDFIVREAFPVTVHKRLDRFSGLALAATEQAWADACLGTLAQEEQANWGVSFGTALGGFADAEVHHERFLREGSKGLPPALAAQIYGGSALGQIALRYNLRGYGLSNNNSCAAGAVALGEGWRAVRDGLVTGIIAAAAEAPLAPLAFAAFAKLKALSLESDPQRAQRPFDQARDGFVMAESAAALILEERSSALHRGAKIYAEIIGYGLTNDAFHPVSSRADGSGAAAAMRLALTAACRAPAEIDLVHAHGSGTQMNDGTEAKLVREFFGKQCPALTGTKGTTGHALGAAAAVESLITVLALQQQTIPPTIHCDHPDVPAGFPLVRQPQERVLRVALKNAFGFGGVNASLVFCTHEP